MQLCTATDAPCVCSQIEDEIYSDIDDIASKIDWK